MDTAPWLDRSAYPFAPKYLETAHGRVHYVDEGKGAPIVFVHGNPTWSFMFRKLIAGLSSDYRCVAIDHLGFGLSDKPPAAPYGPQLHARNLASLIETLGLTKVTLVLHDWGGPIGMAYALEHPDNVSRIVISNTHFWSLKGIPAAERFSAFMGGPVGRWLCRRLNAFPRFIMPFMYGGTGHLPKHDHRQYLAPFASPDERNATWRFAKAIVGESAWLASLWDRRAALSEKRFRIFWGLRDPVGTAEKLSKWQSAFPNHETTIFEDVGHFLPEQLGDRLIEPMRAFMASQAGVVSQPPMHQENAHA